MAAGKGTRMRSQRPKVLHLLAERALLDHVLDTAQGLGARQVVVVTGHESAQVQTAVQATERAQAPVRCVAQSPQLGTGHAVLQAMPALTDDGMTLVLSGDVPLTTEETLRALVAKSAGTHLALLTVQLPQPTGYGRILRDAQDAVTAIREEKDANDAERLVTEVYSGIMAVPTAWLRGALDKLTNNNQQGEYYLTDVVAQAVADGLPVQTHCIQNAWEVAGVNSAAQLAALERIYQRNRADALLDAGVRLADPARFDVRG